MLATRDREGDGRPTTKDERGRSGERTLGKAADGRETAGEHGRGGERDQLKST